MKSKTSKRSNDSCERSDIARQRYLKVLTTTINVNCSHYEWGKVVAGALRARDFPRLFTWAESTKTVVYGDAAEHFAATQVAALIRKYPWHYSEIGLPVDPETRAFDTFIGAELRCRNSNRRFSASRYRRSRYSKYIEYMRRWIHRVLGDAPPLRDIYDKCDFSSGAAIGVHGNATNLFRKLYAGSWSVTPSAKQYALHALWSNDQILVSFMDSKDGYVCFDVDVAIQRMREKCTLLTFNKVSFVPKTATTHRSIAVEPLLNAYVQSGVDSWMRDRLLEWGYDLKDQGRNAHLAWVGSSLGTLATMDLSAASDSISIALCRAVLPPDWFEFLDCIRSPSYSYRGETHRYEKFVTMGNGFCFPLQTLLYAAAVRAAIHYTGCERTHSVYGDDIIVPTSAFELTKQILNFAGFTVNPDKSFCSGPFRESCGADWYNGLDVRPVYLDYHLSGETQLMIFHNVTLRSALTSTFFECVRPLLREWVPRERRFTRPTPYRHRDTWRRKLDFYELATMHGAFDVDLDTFMTSRFSSWCRLEQRWRWKERSFIPVEDVVDEGDCPHEFHRAEYLAFLRGSPGGRLNRRRETRRAIIMK